MFASRVALLLPAALVHLSARNVGRNVISRPLKKYRNLAKNNTARKIGSTDICQRCGKPYIVKGGLQKYCPECAPVVLKEKTEPTKRAWTANYREQNPDHKKNMQKNRTICVVCGKTFTAVDRSNACSPECLAILKKQQQYHKDIKRGRYKNYQTQKENHHDN